MKNMNFKKYLPHFIESNHAVDSRFINVVNNLSPLRTIGEKMVDELEKASPYATKITFLGGILISTKSKIKEI